MECFGTPDTKNNLNKTTRKVQIPKAHTKTANRSDGIPSRARPRGATRIGRNRYQKPNKSKILSFLLFYFVKVSPARAVTSSFLRKRRWRHPGCCVSKLCITPPPKNTEKNSQAPPPPIASSPYHEGGEQTKWQGSARESWRNVHHGHCCAHCTPLFGSKEVFLSLSL